MTVSEAIILKAIDILPAMFGGIPMAAAIAYSAYKFAPRAHKSAPASTSFGENIKLGLTNLMAGKGAGRNHLEKGLKAIGQSLDKQVPLKVEVVVKLDKEKV